ncbi:LacI family transcriptional regulator [Streptomyces dioscori]|uniref:LacI family transcriptional regulator n=1 Tax=Streptomyces dioscori TaxID=2109333 RepID=A0A2P8Q621_9ACTN|nr:helix-turn-helix domain-containing protein [Streptomyces dioscori]PSM41690.1 LacI family transcriptional regulator [Streptomyces dioscori]
MGFPENRGTYWRGRFKISKGKYGRVLDENGIRFRTKREAKQAADAEEAKVRGRTWKDPEAGQIAFGEYASGWYAGQDRAASAMQNYRRHLEENLIPEFEDHPLASIQRTDVDAWKKKEKALYAISSVMTWRGTLHLVLEDEVDDELISANPATKRRGRGKRASRSRDRGPEKVVTDPLGILLCPERASLFSGRDDEFVAVVTKGCTGMRWGEIVGLETEFIRRAAVRVEWQRYELDSGGRESERCPPEDDSYRTIDAPQWLTCLWTGHVARTQPKPCACHANTYMFRGQGVSRTGEIGAKVVDVARRAGVSTGTVSNVLNRPEFVAEATKARVREAVKALGFTRGGGAVDRAAHWRRNGFATWLFTPATSGWYPKKAPQDARPVPLLADPWPGVPVRGRGSQARADACWVPVAKGLTPHGLRHTHKTRMEGFRTPPKLIDERMGHIDGSVQARYSHITREMREQLKVHLTVEWEASLDSRLSMCGSSPVSVLDDLLRDRLRVRQ